MFGLTFLFCALLQKTWMDPKAMAWIMVLMAAPGLGIFGIVPTAIAADIASEDTLKTGVNKVAVFFGSRNFMMKFGTSIANLLFPSFLLLGKSAENPLGIRLSAWAAMGLCAIGFVLFLKYKDGHSTDELSSAATNV